MLSHWQGHWKLTWKLSDWDGHVGFQQKLALKLRQWCGQQAGRSLMQQLCYRREQRVEALRWWHAVHCPKSPLGWTPWSYRIAVGLPDTPSTASGRLKDRCRSQFPCRCRHTHFNLTIQVGDAIIVQIYEVHPALLQAFQDVCARSCSGTRQSGHQTSKGTICSLGEMLPAAISSFYKA